MLLIDEIDRADDEFEAFLLEVLSSWTVSIPELGTISATVPPMVVLTSNRTRELHDALKRRCLYHWIDHPGPDREVAIVRSRIPEVTRTLAARVVGAVQHLRAPDPVKPPGVAETLDWVAALQRLGAQELDLQIAARTPGAVIKYREDADRVRDAPGPGPREMTATSSSAPGRDRAPRGVDEVLPGAGPRGACSRGGSDARPVDRLPRGSGDRGGGRP
ncbi:MoxR family ATPase [Janibacter limosus]|uniref:AAA family ATPase n=1 Tax=Janibacter limosus TaxID=53458 RepID=UPI0035E1DC5B|nr:MoxR family ATPase [Janibacter limosus]